MLKKIFVTIISLFLLTQPLLSGEKEDLINLLGKKNNSGFVCIQKAISFNI